MSIITLEQRVRQIAKDQLVGKYVSVVSQCTDVHCDIYHFVGTFSLVTPSGDNWLAISSDQQLVWLHIDLRIVSGQRQKDWTVGHPLPDLKLEPLSPESTIQALETFLEPRTQDKSTATPGSFWAWTRCQKCSKLRTESGLILATRYEVQTFSGSLAVLPAVLVDIAAQVLRAGDALCKCTSQG